MIIEFFRRESQTTYDELEKWLTWLFDNTSDDGVKPVKRCLTNRVFPPDENLLENGTLKAVGDIIGDKNLPNLNVDRLMITNGPGWVVYEVMWRRAVHMSDNNLGEIAGYALHHDWFLVTETDALAVQFKLAML